MKGDSDRCEEIFGMTTKLLIVESPAKCKKIQGFLGAGWRVQATMGHIRALKESLEGIGFDSSVSASSVAWKPHYENLATKSTAISALRKAAASSKVYLGSDDDREGEAIAWHTCQLLGLDPAETPRVIFHEVTESALRAAVASPGRIDMNKFEAQQARSMLDLLIGFTLSPCLWRGVGFKPGLSAGRCQTPALRIIYDRDRLIEAHESKTSWRLGAKTARELVWKGVTEFTEEAVVRALLIELSEKKPKELVITDRQERVATSKAPAPFITSSLQQEASNRLSMNPKITMKAAQTLYEAGHITYMRTDNAVLSEEAATAARELVETRWGAEYVASSPSSAPVKKKGKGKKEEVVAAAAHEAIRPTHLELSEVSEMSAQEQRLYRLIWIRTVQSVMADEKRDVVRLTAMALGGSEPPVQFQTEWEKTQFAGWRIVEDGDEKEKEAEEALFVSRADLKVPLALAWSEITGSEVRSAPPSRYTEASLIRELESRGIGRPSTYATLVETVIDRGYVEKSTIAAVPVSLRTLVIKRVKGLQEIVRTEKSGGERDKMRVTALGRTVIEWLLGQFGDILEYGFTAAMESKLDEVAKGTREWRSVLTESWEAYKDRYAAVLGSPVSGSGSGSGSSVSPSRSANCVEFGDGYKLVVSKKGPLFVLEQEGQKTRFAAVPAKLSVQTATRADAEAAFASSVSVSASGDQIGELEGDPVNRKKGQYGHYVTWRGHNVSCKEDETLEELGPRLLAKVDAIDHQVGPYRIKKGPYGLYMYKQTEGGRKPRFVSLPDTTEWKTLSVESAEAIYKHMSTTSSTSSKKSYVKKKKGAAE
jgi:DNA topoisomerase-1